MYRLLRVLIKWLCSCMGMHTKCTDTRSPPFQSTGQSDQLIGDFEGATWSRVIGWAGFNNWSPGTLTHVPVCSPQRWSPANEEAGSNSPSVAWPYWRAQRLKCGRRDENRNWEYSMTILYDTVSYKAGATLNTWKHRIHWERSTGDISTAFSSFNTFKGGFYEGYPPPATAKSIRTLTRRYQSHNQKSQATTQTLEIYADANT